MHISRQKTNKQTNTFLGKKQTNKQTNKTKQNKKNIKQRRKIKNKKQKMAKQREKLHSYIEFLKINNLYIYGIIISLATVIIYQNHQ